VYGIGIFREIHRDNQYFHKESVYV